MHSQKVLQFVTPAKAGVQNLLNPAVGLDSSCRRNDGKCEILTFYECIKVSPRFSGSAFSVQGSRFRVQGSGFRVETS